MIGCLMVLCLFGSFAAAEGVSKEAFYEEGIAVLGEMTVEYAQDAAENFRAAGSYKQATEYRQYALSLIDILSMGEKEVNLQSAMTRLQLAGENEEFRNSLAEKDLPSCEALIQYIQARQYEEAGDYIAALDIYKSIRSVLDSMDRLISLSEAAYRKAEELYRNGDYVAAAEIFQNLDYAGSAEKYQQVLANHKHQWKEATCTEPKTCLVFGETEGKPLGHDWHAATCSIPKTCKRCGATEGKPLGHDWQIVSCYEPEKCSRCGATRGTAPGHNWQSATCTDPKTCTRCGATEGKALGHKWQEATCTAPKTCTRCGKTEGKALGHKWQEATCTAPKTCTRCGKTEGKALGHKWQEATCTVPKTCTRCRKTEGKALGHKWQEATFTEAKKCTRCGKTSGSPLIQVGNIVTFGHYEQDNNLSNGSEAIEWIVLDVHDGKALLLSRYGLDAKPYNTEFTDITWEKCTLRSWLNNEFLRTAFSSEEQTAILITTVDNSANQHHIGFGWCTNGGNNTQDKVFLLSCAEVEQYLSVKQDFRSTEARVTPTEYAIKAGADANDTYKTADGSMAGWWWLRSPGYHQHSGAAVDSAGVLSHFSSSFDTGIVRPALWLNLNSGIF